MPHVDWGTLTRKPREEQQRFFEEQLQREPITDFDSIRVGDHLVTENKMYFHHFLCIGKDNANKPKIIHYYGTPTRALRRIVPISSSKSFGAVGKVTTMVLPDKEFIKDRDDLIEKKVQRIIWPELLSRFSVEQVIERALGREGETCYDMLQNNCEHFVTWCMCDLSISIQVKRVYLRLRSALYALLAGGVHLARHEGVQRLLVLFFKLIANFTDEATGLASFLTSPAEVANTATYAAYGVTCLIETGIALYGVWRANKMRKQGILIKSNQEFVSSVAKIISKCACRAGLGIAGSAIGQVVCPIPLLGSLLGGVAGAILGHFIGVFIGWLVKKGIIVFGKSVDERSSLADNYVVICENKSDADDDDDDEDDENEWEIIDVM